MSNWALKQPRRQAVRFIMVRLRNRTTKAFKHGTPASRELYTLNHERKETYLEVRGYLYLGLQVPEYEI